MFQLSIQKINPQQLKQSLMSHEAGAFCCFEGWVRNHNDDKMVKSLEYEGHEALCNNDIKQIFKEVKEKFNVIEFKCVHCVGHLQIGDMAIWVGVIAVHRDDAFKACRYIVDQVKLRLPIWKKEHYQNGDSQWINCSDEAQTKIKESLVKESHYYARQLNLKEIGLSGHKHRIHPGTSGVITLIWPSY